MQTENNGLAVLQKEAKQLQAVLAISVGPNADVRTLVLEELKHLEYAALSKPEILKCDPRTMVAALRKVMRSNLSLDPYQGLVYIKTRNVNIGTKAAPNNILALEIEPTANGLISENRQAGRILDVDRPEVKYDSQGVVISVSVRFLKSTFDDKGNKATRWQEIVFDQSDILRWKKASHRQNSGGAPDGNFEKANALYRSHNGGVDPEFARAKAIRHGLKKLGTNLNEKGVAGPAGNAKPIIDPTLATTEANEEFQQYEEVKDIPMEEHPSETDRRDIAEEIAAKKPKIELPSSNDL